MLVVVSVFLMAHATGDVRPPTSRRSSSARVEVPIEQGTVSLPADAIPEGGLLLQTASGTEIVRAGDETSRAVPGVGAPLDLSPDGSTVLGSTDAGLVAVDVGSGEIRLLVGAIGGGAFVSAQWSPDGTIVVYTTEAADGPAGDGTLCTVAVASCAGNPRSRVRRFFAGGISAVNA